jgi:hypothetical protein
MTKFNPPFFMDICKQLIQNRRDNASMRTVIGRSYYSAFLYCRDYLESEQGHSYTSDVPHGKIWSDINYLSTRIGSKLNRLFICRLVSDYDLNTPNTRTLDRSGVSYTAKCDYNEAKQAMDAVETIKKEIKKIPPS